MRKVSEAASSEVEWDDVKREVKISKDTTDIESLKSYVDVLNFYKSLNELGYLIKNVKDHFNIISNYIFLLDDGISDSDFANLNEKMKIQIEDSKKYIALMSKTIDNYTNDKKRYDSTNIDAVPMTQILESFKSIIEKKSKALEYLESYSKDKDINDFNKYLEFNNEVDTDFYSMCTKSNEMYAEFISKVGNYK